MNLRWRLETLYLATVRSIEIGLRAFLHLGGATTAPHPIHNGNAWAQTCKPRRVRR